MPEATNPIPTASNPRVGEDWVLVPRELSDAMVQAGGSMLPPTHRLTDCYDYFREAWTAALDARPIPPGALAGEARRAETEGLGSRASDGEAGTPEATPQSSPSQTPVDPQMTVDPWQLITTAPRNGTLVAIKGTYLGGGDWESKGWFETSPADRCWYDAANDEPCRPTHWHPIAPSDAPSTTEADR